MIEPLRETGCNYGTLLKKAEDKVHLHLRKMRFKLPERKIGTLLKVLIWVKKNLMKIMFNIYKW